MQRERERERERERKQKEKRKQKSFDAVRAAPDADEVHGANVVNVVLTGADLKIE